MDRYGARLAGLRNTPTRRRTSTDRLSRLGAGRLGEACEVPLDRHVDAQQATIGLSAEHVLPVAGVVERIEEIGRVPIAAVSPGPSVRSSNPRLAGRVELLARNVEIHRAARLLEERDRPVEHPSIPFPEKP